VAVADAEGKPFASLSVAGPAEHLPPARLPAVVRVLREHARRLSLEALRLADP
jgi:DNA-binding IclR family transcriptional regulator